MIVVDNYCKLYRDTVAVTDLSFRVEPGQILGLVGPNGAGKTTTLRALAGIIPPTRGSLSIAGFDLARAPVEAKRRLAIIPDDPQLFGALTVMEHLNFTATTYEVSDWSSRAMDLLEQFELTEKKGALAQELSRGMRQKLAICCAYLHDPQAILFDEPLTGLDPLGIRVLKQSIRQRAQEGAAVIVSSHLLVLVEDLCTDLLILERGRLKFFGSVSEARNMFVGTAAAASLEEIFFRATSGNGIPVEPGK